MVADLIKPFSEQEIELVIRSLPRNKALRPMDIQVSSIRGSGLFSKKIFVRLYELFSSNQ
ncbi:hypothetical protein QJS04_geneDACA015497 [Acorus gramineus]|uniref:Uncharacterized protein n=1 Tax=Acorus gramineus TaxID=55184 RepID=A0AAV9A5S7_ACOGR|nr:hypothetical protein QJS04_geneDACA015497 [Acorus gramineus]